MPGSVAITGASGFVGAALMQHLQAEGMKPVGLSRKQYAGLQQVNYADIAALRKAFSNCNTLIHTAAIVHQPGYDDAALYEESIALTKQLLEAAKGSSITHIIFISSVAVYGAKQSEAPIAVDHPTNPLTAYGKAKLESELLIQQHCDAHNIHYTIIRAPLLYGKNAPGNIAKLTALCKKPLPLPLGSIRNRRSLLYIGNVTHFIAQQLHMKSTQSDIVLLTDNNDISTSSLLRHICALETSRAYLLPFSASLLRIGLHIIGKKKMAQQLLGNLQFQTSSLHHNITWQPDFRPEDAFKTM